MVIAPVPRGTLMKKVKKIRWVIQSIDVCMRGPPVVSKPTGFQDSEPGVDFGLFGAVTWAGRRCRRLS